MQPEAKVIRFMNWLHNFEVTCAIQLFNDLWCVQSLSALSYARKFLSALLNTPTPVAPSFRRQTFSCNLRLTKCVNLNYPPLAFAWSFLECPITRWQKTVNCVFQVCEPKKNPHLKRGEGISVKCVLPPLGWEGASSEDDAGRCISNGPLPHIKTPSQRAHVIRQRLFSPAVPVSVRERELEWHTQKRGREMMINGRYLLLYENWFATFIGRLDWSQFS